VNIWIAVIPILMPNLASAVQIVVMCDVICDATGCVLINC